MGGTGILPVVWNGHLARGVERASCPWCGTGILPVVWNGHLARGVERAATEPWLRGRK
ncbi:hypothetical protein [Moorena sp. SIOASIH]|uniref:hypothetical protein n=1 Tax=Moorena sp. SIOASIH TaxID=2607817 RepID=UPI0025E29D48|nr:hypothetical protein [Moorena sp. SIOASIH]